jgi:hypothetical protein
MAFLVVNKFSYPTGAPDANDVYPGVSSTWGDDGAGVLNNGTIAFPTAAGGAGQVLTDVGGTGVLTFADAPSTPPSGILGSVQLSDGAGGFTSDQPSFNYNSTTKRLGIGKVATTSLDVLHDDIDVNALLENVSASFDEIAVGLKLKHRSTNSMDPGLGISQEYYIEDDTSGELLAGSITFQRQSADALRKFVVKGGTNGTQELFSIDSNREFTIEGGLRSGFGFGFTPPDNSLAWNINNAGASVIIGNGGSGIGLRVLANSGNILSLEDTNQVAQVLVSNTGLVTFNAEANATADVEVKSQTSGTATYTDVSAGFFGVGGVPDRIFSVNAASNITSSPRIVRNTSLTDSVSPALELENFSTGNMVDGFGTEIGFQIRDSGSESNIGRVRFVRDGADNQGKFVVLGGTNASDELFTIDSNNKSVFNVSGALNGDLEVLGSGGSTSVIYAKASNNRTGFGTDTPGGVIHTVGPTPIIIQRENSSNNSPQAGIDLLHKTSLDALDGLGPSVRFGMQDNTSVHVVLGEIAAVRDGADTEGKIIFKTGTNGSEQMASIDASGKTTFNEAALSGGDFEVKAENIGTATYTDVSERKFGVGTDSPLNPLHIFSDGNGVPVLSHAKGTSTNSLFLAADFRHTTIADMVDDFATGFRFQIEDSAEVVNTIASVYARRDGADNEGKLEFLAGTNGTEVGLTINSDLVIDVAQNFSRLTMVTDTSSVHSIDRENATNSASIKSSLRLKTKSDGASPVDGFGSGMFFMIEDLGGTAEVIGQLGFAKDGALNKGALEIKGGIDGNDLLIEAKRVGSFTEIFLNLPTSAGTAGSLWNDSGTVKVA